MLYLYELSSESPGESSPQEQENKMYETAMIITVVSVMYLAAWSLHSHDKMSGIMPSILAVMAATILVVEITAYAVILLPVLPWAASAAVFTATATLFAACALARADGRSKLLRDKSR